MSLIPTAEVKRSQARSATDAQAVTAEALAAEALIAEARAQARPRPAAAATGIVTGHLAACFAIPPTRGRRVTPGTVVSPKGPAVASQHISDNYDQTFRFALPAGHYVLAGQYDHGSGYYTFREVTVTAGANLRVDLPNACM